MNEEMIESIFPGTLEKISKGICPSCDKPIGTFRDSLSKKENELSGLCQKCQDSVFGK